MFNFNAGGYIEKINSSLEEYIPNINLYESKLLESMAYSLLNPGKRLRAVLALEFCSACCGDTDLCMPFACAVEMIHTYSLIHDDLPCMDDDDLRRGKPSNHIVFGENTAVLAGDALLNLAFETMLNSKVANNRLMQDRALKCARELSKSSGVCGMIGGQAIDLEYENREITTQTAFDIYTKKTAAIIIAACKMGCIIAGANDKMVASAEKYAKNLGLAFQIVDDILDLTSDEKTLGKPIKSDLKSQKSTYVSIVGLSEARVKAHELTQESVSALCDFNGNTDFLKNLALYLEKRKV